MSRLFFTSLFLLQQLELQDAVRKVGRKAAVDEERLGAEVQPPLVPKRFKTGKKRFDKIKRTDQEASVVEEWQDSEQTQFISSTWGNRFQIICPFLGLLVNEEVLPIQSRYERQFLRAKTILSGLPVHVADEHVQENFRYTRREGALQYQDLFNLEGVTNEHQFSSGINDCETTGLTASSCQTTNFGGIETLTCSRNRTSNKNCGVPSESRFDQIFSMLDRDQDDTLDEEEISPDVVNALDRSRQLVPRDRNAFGEGTIPGAFNLILTVFGETPNFISYDRLYSVFIDREFPYRFKWPGGYGLRVKDRRRRRGKYDTEFGDFDDF